MTFHCDSQGVSKASVDAIPTETFTAESIKDSGGAVLSCSVCQDDFAAGESACKLGCKHFFHKECLEPWLKDHNTCPTCREVIPETTTGGFADGDRAGGAGEHVEAARREPARGHRNERSAADIEDEQLRIAVRASLQEERERAAAPTPAEREEAELRAAMEASMRDAPPAHAAAGSATSSSSSSSSSAAAAAAAPAPSAPAASAARAVWPVESDWEVVHLVDDDDHDDDDEEEDPSDSAHHRAAVRASVEEARRVERVLSAPRTAGSAGSAAGPGPAAAASAPAPDADGPAPTEAQRLYDEFLAWEPQDLLSMCRDNHIPLPENPTHEACARRVAATISMVSRAASASETLAATSSRPASGSPHASASSPPPAQRSRMAGRPEAESPASSAGSPARHAASGPGPSARVPSVLEEVPPPASLDPDTELEGGALPVRVELTLPSGRTVTHYFNPVSHLTAIAALAIQQEPASFETHPESRFPLLGLQIRSEPAPPRAALSGSDGHLWLAPWAQSFRDAGIAAVSVAAKQLNRYAFDSMNPMR